MAHGLTEKDQMFSVREMPWHRHKNAVVLDEYPESIDDALDKAGLGWKVTSGDVMIVTSPEWTDDFEVVHPAEYAPALTADGTKFKANIREDTGDLLGIVTDDYKVVDNRDAFRFLDALIASDLHFETAGSLWGGRRVWVLAGIPDHIEVGGDKVRTYVYVANSHDGSMAVTAGATPIRIVCANTLGATLSRAEGVDARRTFRFRHTGDLSVKFEEARRVIGMTINYEKMFKQMGDRLAQQPLGVDAFRKKVVEPLFPIEDEMGTRAKNNRERSRDAILRIFEGNGPEGDTQGNAPGTKWAAWNACGEYFDYSRRYTKRTDQVQRSFEDIQPKDRALELVVSA